jgi:archaeosine-15-forming tRNA-guanine transglycosylase
MKSFAPVVAALLVTVGAANAGEIVITPKASDSVLVLTIRGGKDIGAANAGEFVINPKASDRAVVLTIRGGKVVKASVIAKPESMAELEHLKDAAASP